MSHLGTTIQRLLRQYDRSPAELSRALGIHQSLFSRILNGKTTNIERKNLEAIAGYFNDPLDSAQVIAASLMDRRSGPGSEFVKISVESSRGKRNVVPVSPKLDRAINYLRDFHGDDQTVESMIVNLAEMKGMPKRK